MDEVSKLGECNVLDDEGSVLKKSSRVGGPVTCVSLPQRDCVVWALGPHLERKNNAKTSKDHDDDDDDDKSSNKLLVFPRGGAIHGISYVENNKNFDSVVYGQCQLAFCNNISSSSSSSFASTKKVERIPIVVENSRKEEETPSQQHLKVSDWIWDVTIFNSNSQSSPDNDTDGNVDTMVIGMAHHKIDIWNINGTQQPLRLSHRLQIDGAPCVLLTSMHLFRRPDDSLSIAAGSSFHNIHVWSVGKEQLQGDSSSTSSSPPASQCLKGHAGVIHDVKFDSDGRSLASTSDDRSVRLWNIVVDNNNDNYSGQWEMKWAGWGHTARVWSVAFVDKALIASVAEDGKLFLWCRTTGKALSTIEHSCSLWSIGVLKGDNNNNNIAIVGTCDGTVALYDLDARLEGRRLLVSADVVVPDDRPAPVVEEPSAEVIVKNTTENSQEDQERKKVPAISKKKKKKAKKILAQVIVGLEWTKAPDEELGLLIATRAGSIMKLNAETKVWAKLALWWQKDFGNPENINATDGCCMKLNGQWAAIGTTRGHVVVVSLTSSPSRFVLSAAHLKSVQGLNWIDSTTLISFHVRAVAIWKFVSPELEKLDHPSFILNLDTKGVPMCCAYDDRKQRAVVGDSRGNLSLFDMDVKDPEYNPSSGADVRDATSSIPRIHQKEHVTQVALMGDTICSVGNDGNIHTSYISGSSICKGWSMPASSMTGISKLINWSGSQLYISGYHGNTYRMIDMATGYEFLSVDTGGRQRIHNFAAEFDSANDSIPSDIRMAVCMGNKDGSNKLSLHRSVESTGEIGGCFYHGMPTHTETIFGACFFGLGGIERRKFLLTGSEDCSSKISLYDRGECLESLSLTPQESCVRAVCSSQFDETCALLVIGGGKLVLQFFLVSSKNDSGGVKRISDLKIQFIGHGVTKRDSTIDHRINEVKALPLDATSRTHLVVACDSDGNCHLFLISEQESRPGVPQGMFIPTSPRPLLCVQLLPIGNRVLVLLGTTGGDILAFDIPGLLSELVDKWNVIATNWVELASFKGHQMGTNALCVSSLPTVSNPDDDSCEVRVRICSGGDDQAICICELAVKCESDGGLKLVNVPEPRFKREASFSAIKGIFEFSKAGNRIIVTAGYSQQLAMWLDHQSKGENLSMSLLDRLDVDLGDINCLAVDEDPESSTLYFAVCGLGIENFAYSLV